MVSLLDDEKKGGEEKHLKDDGIAARKRIESSDDNALPVADTGLGEERSKRCVDQQIHATTTWFTLQIFGPGSPIFPDPQNLYLHHGKILPPSVGSIDNTYVFTVLPR